MNLNSPSSTNTTSLQQYTRSSRYPLFVGNGADASLLGDYTSWRARLSSTQQQEPTNISQSNVNKTQSIRNRKKRRSKCEERRRWSLQSTNDSIELSRERLRMKRRNEMMMVESCVHDEQVSTDKSSKSSRIHGSTATRRVIVKKKLADRQVVVDNRAKVKDWLATLDENKQFDISDDTAQLRIRERQMVLSNR